MTTPESENSQARVTRDPPKRTGPIRSASMAFRAAEAPADEVIQHGVENAYRVCEEYMRQGEYAAHCVGGHHSSKHRAGYYDHHGRDPATIAWNLWVSMIRSWANGPASVLGAMLPDLGEAHCAPRPRHCGDAHCVRCFPHHGGHPHGAPEHGGQDEGDAKPRCGPQTPEKRPETQERTRIDILADRKVYVTLSLPGAAMLPGARLTEMKRTTDGAVDGGVRASLAWDPSRCAAHVSVRVEGAVAGTYVGDVMLEGFQMAVGTIQVIVEKHGEAQGP